MKHLRMKAAALAAAIALLCAGCGAPAASAPSSSGGASSLPASSAPAPSAAPAQEADALGEYRAMWVSYLEWESFDFSSEAAFTADADEMMQNCAGMGLNVVIAQVRPFADALYPSELFPWSHLCTGTQGQDPGFDPLAILLESAHSHGLQLEAWLNPYRVRLNATRPAGELAATNPAVEHPEWVKTVGDGVYFDPSLPAVRQLITDGVVELLQNYPELDGIHFDDYFYPTTDPSFDEAEYAASSSGLSLEEWRRENVNLLMRQVYDAVKAQDPTVRFGVSPQGNMDNNYNSQYSDVALWMAEGGYVDYVLPQLYWGYGYTTASGSTRYAFENISAEWAALERAPSVALYFGLGAYRIGDGDGGNYDAAQSGWQTGHTLADMVKDGRAAGADGYVLYRYDFLFKNGAWADLAAQEVENIKAANVE